MNPSNLSHDKVWEDSELQDTWSDALKEYNTYHRLKKMGSKLTIEELEAELEATRGKWEEWDAKKKLKTEEIEETEETEEPINSEDEEYLKALDDVSASKSDETPLAEEEPSSTPHLDTTTTESDQKQQNGAQSALPTPAADLRPAAFGPQTVLGTVKDDALRKMLMAWYYAGYYTGLHEGQQLAQENSEKPSED